MRFFTTLHAAKRLEYFLVSVVIYAGIYALLRYVLEVDINLSAGIPTRSSLGTEDFAYNGAAFGPFAVGFAFLAFALMINAGRRLKDIGQSFGYAIFILLPIIGQLFALGLLTVAGPQDVKTPYGKNQYDPNSWMAPEKAVSSTGISIEGEDVFLPGEDQQAA